MAAGKITGFFQYFELLLRISQGLMEESKSLREEKARFRRLGLAGRQNLMKRVDFSWRITRRLRGIPAWRDSKVVMSYVSMGDEVDTRNLLADLLVSGKRLVVPFCEGNELGLFHLEELDELAPGTLGILEPRRDLRSLASKTVAPDSLDLILVPGLAFDSAGGRIGFGKGYYDRLLARVRPDAIKVGLAFACQLFELVPVGKFDVRMNYVVTENGINRIL